MRDMELESSSFVAVSELVETLSEYAIPVDCRDGQTLFRQGDSPTGLFIVHSGNVEIAMHDVVGNMLFRVPTQPGSLLGLPAAVGNALYSLSAEAAERAQISLVPQEDFARLMVTQPGLAIKVLQVLAAEVRAARDMITV